jgi:alpha-1,3-rhamnosyl/mannosyltransferase
MAHGLVFPSLAEGFGLPVLEAFAAQVPVITSNTTSLPEVAGDSALGVPPQDVEAIAEAMRQLIDDNALCQTLKQKGLKRALHFSWDSCADRTLAVYQKALVS